LVFVAGIATPIITLPQVFEIWYHKNAAGVSVFTWISYLLIAVILGIYGLKVKAKPLIIMYFSMAVLEVFIIIGAVRYG
ncbi:hypothetical protein ACFL96_19535, partial [Thermoproteota archaeon]